MKFLFVLTIVIFSHVLSLRVLQEGGYKTVRAISVGPLPEPFTPSVEERIADPATKIATLAKF